MRNLFLTLLFVLSLALSPFAAQAGECTTDAVCTGFHNPTPAKPAVDNMVCIWFTQPHAGDVQLILYTQEGGSITYQKTRWHAERDKLCFGAWRLKGVSWLVVCDDWGHATRGIPSITRLMETGEIDVGYLGASQ